MNTAPDKQPSKVLLTADVGGYSVAALDLAVRMAAATKTHLRGLFVEDEDLLQLTGLPITREISLVTARERPTSIEQMQRAMRSLANRFEASLRQEAGALKISCSFEYVRGRVRDIGMRPDASITYTIIEQVGRLGSRPRPDRSPRRLLWIPRQSHHEIPALRVLLERFADQPVELVVVGPDSEIDSIEELRRWAQDSGHRLDIQRWNSARLEQQLASTQPAFDCAVISRDESPERLTPILRSLTCPVILVA